MTGFNFDNTYLSLPAPFFKINELAQFPAPQVVIVNHALANEIGLNFSSMSLDEQATLFCGNSIPKDTAPYSQAYAGHQFGNFTMLGDGRAHMLGEHVTPSGGRFDIQFKGSGRTPYSRGGDGLAGIGPMLREYLISEAMHRLGVPTTRSLAVIATGDAIRRERPIPGAVLTRVASSHIRVGTFEYAAATRNPKLLSALLDYTIERHFPEVASHKNKALSLIQAVMERQVSLIVHWMRVGFIHGVMNTDNMALCGESIDFGPCAFMDTYNPNQVFSSIDHNGRYAYSNQPTIAQWNLARLAEALLPLIDDDTDTAVETAKDVIYSFEDLYQTQWLTMMRGKLGLVTEEKSDDSLISALLEWMHSCGADFTNTFSDLNSPEAPTGGNYHQEEFKEWYARYEQRRAEEDPEASQRLIQTSNPIVIPRNHIVEQALAEAEEGDLSLFHEFLSALQNPYDRTSAHERFISPPEPSDQVHQTFCGT